MGRWLMIASIAVGTVAFGRLAPVRASTPAPSATIELSTHQAGAEPTLILRLRYEMQCDWPGRGPLTIWFPTSMRVPSALVADTVLVNGKSAAHLVTYRDRIVVNLPRRPNILCDVIAPGSLTVTFTRTAHLRNPNQRGTYVLRATEPTRGFLATFAIR